MKKRLVLIFVVLSINKSLAWGSKGDEMVAQVAFSYLDENTKMSVLAYLDGMTIEEASTWMDKMKGDKSFDYMKNYHYANFSKGFKVADIEGNNIVHILNKTIQELESKAKLTKEEIKTKILFLFHLVGDLHQPLHVGYADDKGGNNVQLNYQKRGTNLHSFWDSGIISTQNIKLSDCNAKTYNEDELKTIKAINVVAWADESRALLDHVYNYGTAKVQDKYVEESAKIIKKQIQKAGIRLASVLQRLFK